MDLPVAIIFFDDDSIFSDTLLLCQQLDVEVTDTVWFGRQCLALYHNEEVPLVVCYIYDHHGIMPTIMYSV
jgi:hypothetical protein